VNAESAETAAGRATPKELLCPVARVLRAMNKDKATAAAVAVSADVSACAALIRAETAASLIYTGSDLQAARAFDIFASYLSLLT